MGDHRDSHGDDQTQHHEDDQDLGSGGEDAGDQDGGDEQLDAKPIADGSKGVKRKADQDSVTRFIL